MTTNAKLFEIEYYDNDQAEESDPDPVFKAEADNTEDLFTKLSEELEHVQGMNVDHYECAGTIETGDLMYHVFVKRGSERRPVPVNVGVAYIIYPK